MIINLLLVLLGVVLKFVWVLNSKIDSLIRVGVKFSFSVYVKKRWIRWITHLVSSISLSVFVDDIVKYLHSQDNYMFMRSFEAPIIAFLIGMFGYDIIRLVVKTKEKILPSGENK